MSILIKNGTVVNCESIIKGDVLIENGIITAVGTNVKCPDGNVRVIDASGRYIMPGGIDPHTHLQSSFMGVETADDFFTGSKAALAGGTTMLIDLAIPEKDDSIIETYKKWRSMADSKVCCDYGLSVALTTWNPKTCSDMETLTKPEYGINSFKFFLAFSGTYMVDDGQFYQGLRRCSELGALAKVHAENGHVIKARQEELLKKGITGPEGHIQSRPEALEEEATDRACILASHANCPLYVANVMSKGALRAMVRQRHRGKLVFGETVAAALVLDGSHYFDKDWYHAASYVRSPPFSLDKKTPSVLVDSLASGQLHLVGSDHCTYNRKQREIGANDFTRIPNGTNGIEERLSVVWETGVRCGRIDPMQFVSITSANAAKFHNIYPRKGCIAVGSDADIIIWDGSATRTISVKTHHQASDMNIFEGMQLHGVCVMTILHGIIVYENGHLSVEAGNGKFIPLPVNSPYCFATIDVREKQRMPKIVHREGDLPYESSSTESLRLGRKRSNSMTATASTSTSTSSSIKSYLSSYRHAE
ncbi:hypothetical protein AB6A40_001073 [Gnathostoma spinigerum]|uniref:dihydropyrimidinase n=1 Tax=Gnathostoma spinigerum TaxID=75299 RepID=A0ABD6E870_9BILA